MKKAPLLFCTAFLAVLLTGGCELTTPPSPFNFDDVDTLLFGEHIQPILAAKCQRCHTGADAGGGLRLDSWDRLIAGGDNGEALIAFAGDNSLMVRMVSQLMPGPHPLELGADTLTAAEVRALRRWIDQGARFDDLSVPFENAKQLLYVPNLTDASVSVIEPETKLVVRYVDLTASEFGGFSANARPYHVVVDSVSWYVSLAGDNAVARYSHLDNELQGVASFESPGMMALHPPSDLLYVSRAPLAVNPPQSVGEITRSTMTVEEIEIIFQRPHAIVIDPMGKFVHTGSLEENRVITIDTETKEVTFTLLANPVHSFIQFAMDTDGAFTVASGQLSNQVILLDTSAPPGIIRVGQIEVGTMPWHPVFTPDNRFVYIAVQGEDRVVVIDMQNFTIEATIDDAGFAEPHGSTITPDGAYVFVSNRNTLGGYTPRYNFGNNQNVGTVSVINTATNQVERVLEVGRYPSGISPVAELD